MGKYTVISEASQLLADTLKQRLVPDVLANEASIGLCSPADKGDISVGIHLYDVRRDEAVFSYGMQDAGQSKQRYPSLYLSLYYMITVSGFSDIKYRAGEEHRILGKILQTFQEAPILSAPSLSSTFDCRIELQDITFEDKIKIWNQTNIPYKTSLFYKVSPVEIESGVEKSITRVREAEFHVER